MSTGAINFAWLAADKGFRLVAGALVGFAVARYLAPVRFGLLNYVTAIVALFMPLAELGVDAIVRRRLIANPEDAGSLLSTVLRLRFMAGLVLYLGVAGYAMGVSGTTEAGHLLLILGFTLFQPAGYTADLWLQANLRARVSVITGWIALVFGACIRLWLIRVGAELSAFAWVIAGECLLGCGLLWWGGQRNGLPKLVGGEFWSKSAKLLSSSWMMVFSGMAMMLYMRLDMVMLRSMCGNREAGIYAAAVRLSELWYFVPVALASSILPALLLKRDEGKAAYARAMQRYYDLNAAMAYGMILIMVLFARPLVTIIYGAAFADAGPVLEWHAWSAIFVFLGVARGQFLMNESRYAFNLLATVLGAAVNVGLNLWWIPQHGAMGAAWATLVAYGVAAWAISWCHPGVRTNAWMQTRALLIPVLGWRYLIRR